MTCPWGLTNETDAWNALWMTSEEIAQFNDWFPGHFNLKEGDWDGGWGWHNLDDHGRAYAKMFTATLVLTYGIDDLQMRHWLAFMFDRQPAPAPASDPVLAFDAGNLAFMFWRSAAGALIHSRVRPSGLMYQGGYFNFSSFEHFLDVSATCYRAEDRAPTFDGDPVLLGGPDSKPLRVLGMPGDNPGQVVLFTRIEGRSWEGWRSDVLTPSSALAGSPLRIRRPVVIQQVDGSFQLWGTSAAGEIVEYAWSPLNHLYSATVLPFGPADWAVSSTKGALVAVRCADGSNHLFAVRASSQPSAAGDLVHFHQARQGQPWTAENVTHACGSRLRFGQTTSLVVNESAGQFDVYGLAPDGTLLLYKYSRSGCLGAVSGAQPGWSSIDLTNTAAVDALGQRWKLDGSIVSTNRDQILGTAGQLLISFHRSGSGWVQDNLTYAADIPTVRSPLYVAPPGTGSDEVFCVNANGHLVRYAKNPSVPVWFGMDLHEAPSIAARPAQGRLALARSGTGVIHAFAAGQAGTMLFHATEGHAWHSNDDYRKWARGDGYTDFKYVPKEGDEYAAYASWGLFITDKVEMMCPSFATDPAQRAGMMVHEATHHHTHDEHENINDVDMDPWRHHGLDDIVLGALDPDVQRHSCYQMEVEYCADVAEYPAAWVPWSLRAGARTRANALLAVRFTNDPGWVVGEPRPL